MPDAIPYGQPADDDSHASDLRPGDEGTVKAATPAADDALLCPTGCGCRVGTEDADRADCGCDGPCCWDSWDDYIADVLNRPDYYDEMRVARGMQSALAQQRSEPGGLEKVPGRRDRDGDDGWEF